MGLVLAAHQPNFLPWLGFFHKMAQADIFVLLDTVPVGKGNANLANRVKIKTTRGATWLTRPMHRGHSYRNSTWVSTGDKQWSTFKHNYARAPHFSEYGLLIEGYVRFYECETVSYTNLGFITNVRDMLGLDTLLVRQSVTGIVSHKCELMIDLCRHYSADTYLSGQGARAYNAPDLFEEADIELRYQEFEHPIYPQLWDASFVPGLSLVDMLVNCGVEAVKEALCA